MNKNWLRQSNKQQTKTRELISITKSMLSNERIEMKLDGTLNRRVKSKSQLTST